MSVKYYKYDYLQVPDGSEHALGYFRTLRKRYVKTVLGELFVDAHHVFILLENLPGYRFGIVRYYDYRYMVGASKNRQGDEVFTVCEFLRHFKLFHSCDGFRILFFDQVFYYEHGFTVDSIRRLYLHYLRSVCERRLRANAPLKLTREMVCVYSLTEPEARIVRKIINQYNAEATEKIQAEYNALNWLDCINKKNL